MEREKKILPLSYPRCEFHHQTVKSFKSLVHLLREHLLLFMASTLDPKPQKIKIPQANYKMLEYDFRIFAR